MKGRIRGTIFLLVMIHFCQCGQETKSNRTKTDAEGQRRDTEEYFLYKINYASSLLILLSCLACVAAQTEVNFPIVDLAA